MVCISGTVRVSCWKMERPQDNVAYTLWYTVDSPSHSLLLTIHTLCVRRAYAPPLATTLFMTTFPALSSLGHHASSWKLPFLKPFCNRKRNSKTELFVNTRLFCFPYWRYFYVLYSLWKLRKSGETEIISTVL